MIKLVLKLIRLWHLLQTVGALKNQFGNIKISDCEHNINKGIEKIYQEIKKKGKDKTIKKEETDEIEKFINKLLNIE